MASAKWRPFCLGGTTWSLFYRIWYNYIHITQLFVVYLSITHVSQFQYHIGRFVVISRKASNRSEAVYVQNLPGPHLTKCSWGTAILWISTLWIRMHLHDCLIASEGTLRYRSQCMNWTSELFLRSRFCFVGINFPSCEVTREINTSITLDSIYVSVLLTRYDLSIKDDAK